MWVVLACGMLCAALTMGLRNSFGLFLAPMTNALGWSASGYALAIALQVLMNGFMQPVCGQLADRFGARKVIMAGAVLQMVGTLGMAFAGELAQHGVLTHALWGAVPKLFALLGLPFLESQAIFTLAAGVVMGLAVSAAGMPIVNASFARLLPEKQRGRAVGLGTAGSSFGQFLVVPLIQLNITSFGWQAALVVAAFTALLMAPLALPLDDSVGRNTPGAAQGEAAGVALRRAFADPSFWCLFFGFFVCGVHVSFLAVHLPGFAALCQLPPEVGAGAISLIGLFNILGSLGAGELTSRWRRRELLVLIYAARGVLMAGFMMVEKTTASLLIFSAIMGILWLSTVPPTVALCARNWGTRWLATIFGLVFLGHQLGGFTGAFLGGLILDRTGSYDLMWTIGVLAAAFAALIHLPIRDGAPAKAVPAPA